MINIEGKKVFQLSGWSVAALDLVLGAAALYLFLTYGGNGVGLTPPMIAGIICAALVGLTIRGYFIVQPNEAQVFINTGSLNT
jgi:hypothetical protein